MNEAAASDADVIIGVGFSFSERLNDLAERHPEKKSVCIDYAPKTGPATEETAYWRTVAVAGTEWRLVVTRASDSLVK